MPTSPRIRQTVIDAVDIRACAEFYRVLLALEYRPGDEAPTDGTADESDWLVLRDPRGGHRLAFQRVEHLAPTTWPSDDVPMQLHLDTAVADLDDLDAATDRALAAGGRLLLDRSGDADEPLRVIADPAGHPLCIIVMPEGAAEAP